MTSPKQPTCGDGQPRRRPRRRFLKILAGLAAGGAGLGAYARWIEPTWVEVTHHDLPVTGLPPAWEGVRIALVSDLHHSPWVPLDYLAGAMKKVGSLGPDLCAAVGDFVMTLDPAYGEAVAGLFKDLRPPLGTFACLGNHEYGIACPTPGARPLAVVEALRKNGVRVLYGESVRLNRQGQDLWIAGVGDHWASDLRLTQAMRDVPPDAPNLVLCHNPDAADQVAAAFGGTILSGHTHGGQVQIPFFGPPVLPVVHRDRYEGLHRVGRSWLYVNRGLGWWRKVRFNCRPEISVLTLRPAPLLV